MKYPPTKYQKISKLVFRRIKLESYVCATKRISYYRVEVSPDQRIWSGSVNFLTTSQLAVHWMNLVNEGLMTVTQFDPADVYADSSGKWSYRVIVNGLTFRPGSAGLYRRAGEASVAQRADVKLAREQHRVEQHRVEQHVQQTNPPKTNPPKTNPPKTNPNVIGYVSGYAGLQMQGRVMTSDIVTTNQLK